MAGFEEHRDLLFGVAYRVLGRVVDAEDVVQEAWLRWSKVDEESVADPEAFLVTVTTRLAVDRLRRVQARRETYLGEWLPEPVLTDAADAAVQAESVSLAMLVVLESLSPLERAAFVLYEVFELPYADIARALDRNEPAVRQLVARARAHVRERRPRFDVDPGLWRAATDRFIEACLNGGIEGLMELLAPDVRVVADGGGKALAARKIVVGREKSARYILGIARIRPVFLDSVGVARDVEIGFDLVLANGGPALLVLAAGRPIVYFQIEVADGAITTCYVITNPDKLAGVGARQVLPPQRGPA